MNSVLIGILLLKFKGGYKLETNKLYDYEADVRALIKKGDIAIEFINFIKLVGAEDFSSPAMHYSLASKLGSEDRNIVIMAHRGSSKSTLMEYWMLFVAMRKGIIPHEPKPIEFVLGVFSEEKLQRGFIKNIYKKWEGSSFLQKYLVFPKETDLKESTVIQHRVKTKKEKKPYGLIIQTGTILGSLRGLREGTVRPQVIITDDILSTEMAKSESKKRTVSERFNQDIAEIGQIDGSSKFIFIGTPVAPDDLLHELMANPSWVVHKYPVCEAFPVPKEEFRSNWADVKTYEVVLASYNKAKNSATGVSGFYQEMMLQTVDLSSLLVAPSSIQLRDTTYIKSNKEQYSWYIATDLATSEKKSSDFSTIGVFAVNSNGDWILVDGIAKRQLITASWDYLFKFVREYTVRNVTPKVGIEINGTQLSYIATLQREMDIRNVYFDFAQDKNTNIMTTQYNFNYGIRSKGNKTERFVTGVLPLFNNNKIYFAHPKGNSQDYKELLDEGLEELSSATLKQGVSAGKHDDFIDLLNQMSQIRINIPNAFEEEEEVIDKPFNPYASYFDGGVDGSSYF